MTNEQGGRVVLLEKRDTTLWRGVSHYSFNILRNSHTKKDEKGNFYWTAARNCVQFSLQNGRMNMNAAKCSSFERFLSLPVEEAMKSNVWRWYFRTGGHPPYDPNKRY